MNPHDRKVFTHRYYNTYHFAAAVSNALDTRHESNLYLIHEFFLDDEYVSHLRGFADKSLLHYFIWFIVGREFSGTR